MRKTLFAAAALTLLSEAPARAQDADTIPAMMFLSTRETARLVPDQAALYVVIERQGTTPAEAVQRTAEAERSVTAALAALRPGPHAVQFVRYGVAPARSANRSEPATELFVGRTVVLVEVRQLDQLATVSSTALASGASLVGEPQFSSSRADAVRRQLLDDAIRHARAEATVMAAASGGTLGRLRNVNFTQSQPYDMGTPQTLPSDSPYHNANRPVPEVTVRVEVTTSWELTGARTGTP